MLRKTFSHIMTYSTSQNLEEIYFYDLKRQFFSYYGREYEKKKEVKVRLKHYDCSMSSYYSFLVISVKTRVWQRRVFAKWCVSWWSSYGHEILTYGR